MEEKITGVAKDVENLQRPPWTGSSGVFIVPDMLFTSSLHLDKMITGSLIHYITDITHVHASMYSTLLQCYLCDTALVATHYTHGDTL